LSRVYVVNVFLTFISTLQTVLFGNKKIPRYAHALIFTKFACIVKRCRNAVPTARTVNLLSQLTTILGLFTIQLSCSKQQQRNRKGANIQ